MRKITKQEWFVLAITEAVLIGVCLLFAVPSARHPGPKLGRTKFAFAIASTAIAAYNLDRHHFHNGLQDLFGHDGISGGASRKYIPDRKLLCDSWGTEIGYGNLTNAYTLVSAGPDRSFGTADDVFETKGASSQASEVTAR